MNSDDAATQPVAGVVAAATASASASGSMSDVEDDCSKNAKKKICIAETDSDSDRADAVLEVNSGTENSGSSGEDEEDEDEDEDDDGGDNNDDDDEDETKIAAIAKENGVTAEDLLEAKRYYEGNQVVPASDDDEEGDADKKAAETKEQAKERHEKESAAEKAPEDDKVYDTLGDNAEEDDDDDGGDADGTTPSAPATAVSGTAIAKFGDALMTPEGISAFTDAFARLDELKKLADKKLHPEFLLYHESLPSIKGFLVKFANTSSPFRQFTQSTLRLIDSYIDMTQSDPPGEKAFFAALRPMLSVTDRMLRLVSSHKHARGLEGYLGLTNERTVDSEEYAWNPTPRGKVPVYALPKSRIYVTNPDTGRREARMRLLEEDHWCDQPDKDGKASSLVNDLTLGHFEKLRSFFRKAIVNRTFADLEQKKEERSAMIIAKAKAISAEKLAATLARNAKVQVAAEAKASLAFEASSKKAEAEAKEKLKKADSKKASASDSVSSAMRDGDADASESDDPPLSQPRTTPKKKKTTTPAEPSSAAAVHVPSVHRRLKTPEAAIPVVTPASLPSLEEGTQKPPGKVRSVESDEEMGPTQEQFPPTTAADVIEIDVSDSDKEDKKVRFSEKTKVVTVDARKPAPLSPSVSDFEDNDVAAAVASVKAPSAPAPASVPAVVSTDASKAKDKTVKAHISAKPAVVAPPPSASSSGSGGGPAVAVDSKKEKATAPTIRSWGSPAVVGVSPQCLGHSQQDHVHSATQMTRRTFCGNCKITISLGMAEPGVSRDTLECLGCQEKKRMSLFFCTHQSPLNGKGRCVECDDKLASLWGTRASASSGKAGAAIKTHLLVMEERAAAAKKSATSEYSSTPKASQPGTSKTKRAAVTEPSQEMGKSSPKKRSRIDPLQLVHAPGSKALRSDKDEKVASAEEARRILENYQKSLTAEEVRILAKIKVAREEVKRRLARINDFERMVASWEDVTINAVELYQKSVAGLEKYFPRSAVDS